VRTLATVARSLIPDLPPPPDFPIDALGSVLKPPALAIHRKIQAPLAICAQSVLGAAALATQGRANVLLPMGTAKPVSCFFITVAESGERKSFCDREALRGVRQREKELHDQYLIDRERYKIDKAIWDKKHDAILKSGADQADMQAEIAALGAEPPAPLVPKLTCSEPTFEGLYRQLKEGHASQGLFSDEAAGFVGGHGMTPEAMDRTAKGLCKLFDGDELDRLRGGEGMTVLYDRRLSIHLMMQRVIAAKLFIEHLVGQGLISRCLTAAPASTAGERPYRDLDPEDDRIIGVYNATIHGILCKPMRVKDGRRNELDLPSLPLSAPAKEVWKDLVNTINDEQKPDRHYVRIAGFANKLPEHAARLAAILTLVADTSAIEIPVDAMLNGTELALYYAEEALRIIGAEQINPKLLIAQELLEWIQKHWQPKRGNTITFRELSRHSPRAIRERTLEEREAIVTILKKHGWLVPVTGAPGKFTIASEVSE
jgi:hypothetical protein